MPVLDDVERELAQIRGLLKDPAPENLAAVNQKLEQVTQQLGALAAAASPETADARLRAFFQRLPGQMAAIRALLTAPYQFFCALQESRAVTFRAYARDGELRVPTPSSRTLAHL